MKFLCICHYGHSRSVALARQLHGRQQTAIAIGFATSDPDSMYLLCKWADHVLVVDQNAKCRIPSEYIYKTRNFDVGPDRWVNPYHPELKELFSKLLLDQFPDLPEYK